MKRKWKIVFGVLVVAIILGFIYAESTKDLEANLLEVQPRTIANTFKEEGTVVPKVEQSIFAGTSGRIINLPVVEGQQVKKGQLLAALDTKEIDYQISQLQAQILSIRGEEAQVYYQPEPSPAIIRSQELQVEQAKRNLETAEIDLQRIEQLFKVGAVTKKDFEDVVNIVELAKLNLELQNEALVLLHEIQSPAGGTEEFYAGRIEAINSQIEMLQYQKEKSTIVAPINGIVTNLAANKGETVSNLLPMMKIFQSDPYVVEVFVLTADMPSIQINMPVALIQERKDEDVIFAGTVTKIAPAAVETISALGLTEQRVKVTIEPEVPENIELLPGYNLEVEFTLDQRDNVLVVPKAALFPYESGEALWVVREGKAEVQPVTTGFEHNRDVVITSGLNAGDLVVLNPQLEGLQEGKNIAVINR